MRCPWCGSPVMIRGNRWECGCCGDFGDLPPEQREEQALTLKLSVSRELDFPRTWQELKRVLPRNAEELVPQLGSVLIYEISHAMEMPGHTEDREKFEALDRLLQETPQLNGLPDGWKIYDASRWGEVLCGAQGKLTEEFCGTFWKELIEKFPSGDCPEEIDGMMRNLGDVYEYFVSDQWEGEGADRCRELRSAFEYHWYRHQCVSPDLGAVMARLQRDDTSRLDDDCRDILVFSFPDYFSGWSLEKLRDVQWDRLLEDVLEEDPDLARDMWETLLFAAGPDFSQNPEVGERLREGSPFSWED